MKHSSNDASLKLGEERQPPGEDQVIAEIAKLQISITAGSAKATNKPIRRGFKAMSERNKDTVDRIEKMLTKGLSSPLAVPYWSTVPYKLGDGAVKYSVKPVEGNQAATSQSSSVDYLREAMVERLTNEPAAFDFYVQMQTDAETMPIEDPTIPWLSPEIKVATIQIAPQGFDTPKRKELCEESSFSPWHALDVHRPLGGINRARKPVYEASSELRHQQAP